jgi:membrane protein required for colicin V production
VNWLDAAIIGLIIWFTFSAFQAGFIRESVTVAAAVLGVVLAGLYYKNLADDVLVFVDNKTVANLIAFGLIFGATALAGQMLALVLKPTVHMLQLGVFDQLAGAAFGFAKAMVFVQIFLIVFITYPKWGLDEDIDNSFFGSLILDKSSVVVRVLPAEFDTAVDRFNVDLSR